MSSRQTVVEVRLRDPNCFGSILSPTSSIIHLTTKSSSTLDVHAISEIGRVSPAQVGWGILGIGVEFESFHNAGTNPDESEALKMAVIGSVNTLII